MGVRGYPTVSAFLAIQDGAVVVQTKTEHAGGSMGGEHLHIVQDEKQGTLLLGKYGSWNSGASAYFNVTVLYDYNDVERFIYFSAEDGYYRISQNQQYVDEIKSKTNTYITNGDDLNYWKVDGNYVTEADHATATACYTILQDATTPGTLDNPLNLENF